MLETEQQSQEPRSNSLENYDPFKIEQLIDSIQADLNRPEDHWYEKSKADSPQIYHPKKEEDQVRFDKIHSLFALGIIPKIDKDTYSDLEDLYLHEQIVSSKSPSQKFIDHYGDKAIEVIDKWEINKKSGMTELSFHKLTDIIKEFTTAAINDEQITNPKTGLKESKTLSIINKLKAENLWKE